MISKHPSARSLTKYVVGAADLHRARTGRAGGSVIAVAFACLTTAASHAQTPAPICGLPDGKVAALRAAAAADPRYRRDGGDVTHEIWSAESIQAILTFTTAKDPAHPAAICQQVIDRGGTMQIDRQVRCERKAAACTALDAADDGPGGGE